MAAARVYAKVSPNQFLLLNPQFSIDGIMFRFQTVSPEFTEPAEFYNLHDLFSNIPFWTLVQKFVDDKTFGTMYALIGEFCYSSEIQCTSGYLVVIQSTVDIDEMQNAIVNESGIMDDEKVPTHSLHLVIFSGKLMLNKIKKRKPSLGQGGNKNITSGSFSINLLHNPLMFHPQSSGKVKLNTNELLWTTKFANNEDITKGPLMTQNKKRSHVILVENAIKDSLINSADLSPSRGSRQVKSMKVVRREVTDITYSRLEENKRSTTDKVNLREEAISLLDEAFKHHCTAENFAAGFIAMKEQCLIDGQSATTAASVLMDAFYRITDCIPLEEKVITKVGIDIDQVVLKCQLSFSILGKLDRADAKTNNEFQLENNNRKSAKQIEFEFKFLQRCYEILEATLDGSKNESTSYSKSKVIQYQSNHKGSSLESKKQQSQYVNLCPNSVTSEVLNISFRNAGKIKSTTEQVLFASDIVIQFLLKHTKFQNDYSLEHYDACKTAWNNNCNSGEVAYIPGGLLFPILTLLLISYLNEKPITIVVESYGGKRRGVHVHYDFEESMETSIQKAIKNLDDAEEKKITNTIIDAFIKIQESNQSYVKKTSLNMGIGCDATGGKLHNGDSSFLVCSPIIIDIVDNVRKGPTKNVFCIPDIIEALDSSSQVNEGSNVNLDSDHHLKSDSDSDSDSESDSDPKPKRSKTMDLSALTRGAANCSSDTDIDSVPVILRHRYFAPHQVKEHVRYPLFSGLGSWSLSPMTHTMPKRKVKKLLGNEFLDKNKSLQRIQAYCPNVRVLHGKNGVQKNGENLLDIRTFATDTNEKKQSLVCISDAATKADEWLKYARTGVAKIGKFGGMARLELTFQSKSFDRSKILAEGVDTLIRTFSQSTKVYSAPLVATLAEISLLSFEGISTGLFHWFGPRSNISENTTWEVFSEVWNYLTHFATHFFDGRRSFLTNRVFSPRLGYVFSRPLINPTWTGINSALNLICVDDNLEKLKRIWYTKSKMDVSHKRAVDTNLGSLILELEGKFEKKLFALLELLNANTRSDRIRISDAVACSHCQIITSMTESKKSSWAAHPCDFNDLICGSSTASRRNIDVRGEEFDLYLRKITKLLSPSQQESLTAIMGTNQNCFLTGVAGSGKSFLLKVFYPLLIKLYGFSGVVVTGPTNIAASNVFGITLHKFLGLTVDGTVDRILIEQNGARLEQYLKDHIDALNRRGSKVPIDASLCQVFIIDEAGMVDYVTINFLDNFFRVLKNIDRPFGGVRIILIGDVLQLEPVTRKKDVYPNVGKVFYQHDLFKGFFVAYLRSNMRQKDDVEFLNALNKIRIGDGSVKNYFHENIFLLNNPSQSILRLAKAKKEVPMTDITMIQNLNSRIEYFGVYPSRIKPNKYPQNYPRVTNIRCNLYDRELLMIDERIINSEDTGNTDLIICHDNYENIVYTKLKNDQHQSIKCTSKDKLTPYNPRGNELDAAKRRVDLKLVSELQVYVGMSCRVTYATDNEYICTNSLVTITNITVTAHDNCVTHITIRSIEKRISVIIIPVTITEIFEKDKYGTMEKFEFSRCQFGLIDSAGLTPWNLQCLTLSCPVFYDNSRSSGNYASTKGVLYTIMSRVKKKEQLSYLHSITEFEIINGVSEKAKNFDDKYRLKDGVIFDLIPIEY